MNYERTCELIQNDVNNDSYEIIVLNESEPIIFKQTRRSNRKFVVGTFSW
jgi:hypothetical protein